VREIRTLRRHVNGGWKQAWSGCLGQPARILDRTNQRTKLSNQPALLQHFQQETDLTPARRTCKFVAWRNQFLSGRKGFEATWNGGAH
jgi:hypothetical protein